MSNDQRPSPGDEPARVTEMLEAAAAGDRRVADELLPLVYAQLRRVAQQRMGAERADHTLQATALVHEAYARLVGGEPVAWANRAQFFFAAAEAMRRILIDHARARASQRRGGDGRRPPRKTPIGALDLAAEDEPERVLALDEAIARLEAEDPQAAQVVRLRFYAGLSVDETARALGISPRTVDREWAFARATLHAALRDGGA